VPAAHADDVDPADIYISPNKYVDKEITIANVRCISDADEYRCVSTEHGLPVMFSFKGFTTTPMNTYFDENCDTIKKISETPYCFATIVVTPDEITRDELGDHHVRVVVTSEAAAGYLSGKASKMFKGQQPARFKQRL
jgi:hypothetical protein